MALFEKKSKEEKQQEEIQKFIGRYHLEDLTANDLAIVQKIAGDLMGNGLIKAGMALSFAKAEEQAKVTYLSTLVEQNWLMINQLSRIAKLLDK